MGMQNSGLKNLLFVAALCAAPAAAFAQAQGPYISGAGGITMPRDSDTDLGSVDLDDDWAAVGAVGYSLGRLGLRGEVEFGYRQNDVGSIGGAAASGDFKTYSLMGNILYDIPTGFPIRPYIGVGIGGARIFTNDVVSGTTSLSGRHTRFAYQGIAGAAFNITDQLALTADYRYFGVPDMDFTSGTGANVDGEYHTHMVMVGLRFTFGAPEKPAAEPTPVAAPAPPPQPTPAPEPAAPKNYLVFFDWDSADLTPEAAEILNTAAANARKGGVSRIQAIGHADRSGPEQYNQKLSERRAEAVKAALVQQGIPDSEIGVVSKGETDPLVPTPDGVREPQNRRVEIVLQ